MFDKSWHWLFFSKQCQLLAVGTWSVPYMQFPGVASQTLAHNSCPMLVARAVSDWNPSHQHIFLLRWYVERLWYLILCQSYACSWREVLQNVDVTSEKKRNLTANENLRWVCLRNQKFNYHGLISVFWNSTESCIYDCFLLQARVKHVCKALRVMSLQGKECFPHPVECSWI